MNRNLWKKAVFIGVVVLVSIFGIIGLPTSGESLKANVRDNIRLGLDLRGGTHLVLQVRVNDAVNAETDQTIERLKTALDLERIDYGGFTPIIAADVLEDGGILVQGIPAEQTAAFRDTVGLNELNWVVRQVEPGSYEMTMLASALREIRQQALRQSIETIRNRVDSLGVSEPTIQERGRGEYEILVQLPGVDDPDRVKDIMQTTALLEIKAVRSGPYPSREAALAQNSGILPTGTELLELAVGKGEAGPDEEEWYLVARASVVTGRDLRNARVGRDENNLPEVDFTLSTDAGVRFGNFTESNIGNLLAVVLDDRIHSVATIQSRITDSGRILGGYTLQEANDLALVLRAGALPASMRYLEERTVGPSLGADSIRSGLLASLAGLLGVICFMLIYYRMAGVNAIVALLLNLILLMAALAYAGATLTLPGIAGVILIIGMAVDANVLIFERIREELRTGKTVVSSVEAGFHKAFLTIIDTNLTTLIAAFFLFLFGTGPVKGFAVTLSIGLVANIFTAVFVSRVIFDYILSRKLRQASLSI
ncbi:MAG: protein translocase subunit SecD [Acidobacteria bacterium]|nr:protein translocase subunit SecD [Acidobacteriota bacterium]